MTTHQQDGAPLGNCERIRLLLSLAIDGETTPQHRDEIAAHVPACDGCRAARAVDQAVRAHMEAALATLTPGELARLVIGRATVEARAANRFLMVAAAAAVLIAVAAGAVSRAPPPAGPAVADGALDRARASARLLIPGTQIPAAKER